jgi:thiol-disulfide isomerase/thioredoxin
MTRNWRTVVACVAAAVGVLAVSADAAQPVLVVFSASWCPHCQAAKPIVARIQNEGVDVILVDVDKNRGKVKDYGVETIPCFLTIEPGAEPGSDSITGRKSGHTTEPELRAFLKQHGVKPKPLARK